MAGFQLPSAARAGGLVQSLKEDGPLTTLVDSLALRVRGGLFEYSTSPEEREKRLEPPHELELFIARPLTSEPDLFRTVTEGIPGQGGPLTFCLGGHRIMPSFRHMHEEQRLELLEFVKSLHPAFWELQELTTVEISAPIGSHLTPERIARGRQLYMDAECWQCHGQNGRGDVPSAQSLKDNTELPIQPADLTRPLRVESFLT
ncbi:MAG: c-type cytochrome [Nitrospinae bacterium]|nr:c-type cytochrome [Nitrospinota bacterium]